MGGGRGDRVGGKGGQGGEIGTNKSSSVKMCGGGGWMLKF